MTSADPRPDPGTAIDVTTSTPGPGHRRAAVTVAAGLIAVSAFALAQAATPWPQVAAFLPAFGAAIVVTETITTVLLLAQFRIAREPALALLAAGYAYSAAIVVPHMLMFPGVLSEGGLLGAGPQSAVWLWMLWHGGFPLFVSGYALAAAPDGRTAAPAAPTAPAWLGRALAAGAVALAALLAVLVSAGHDLLPTIIVAGDYRPAMQHGVAPAVWLSNAAAVALLALRRKVRTVMDLWLAVAALASLLDVTVTLTGGARYSAGWYLARLNSAASAGVILVALLREVTLLYQRVVAQSRTLARLAAIDGLTGIANRRSFDDALALELRRAHRAGRPLALLMADVDFFKRFNDRYGHPAGDACLQRIAGALAARARRPGDLAARFGGEEFVLLLPDTDEAGAAAVARAVLADIAALAIPHETSEAGAVVSVSIGLVAGVPAARSDPAALVAAADGALYEAKRRGRARWVAAPRPGDAPPARAAAASTSSDAAAAEAIGRRAGRGARP